MALINYTPDNTKIIHNTKVDFSLRKVVPSIHIVQYDTSLPIVKVDLYLGGQPYVIPATADLKVRVGKKDKTFIYKDVLGCTPDRKSVYFEIDEQMTIFFGDINPILELLIKEGNVVRKAGSSPIYITIDRNPIQETDIESSNEYIDLTQAVADAKQAKSDAYAAAALAGQEADNAEIAKEAAQEAQVGAEAARDEAGQIVADVTVKKANRYIDEPIAELNNHTLREVFEDNNKYLATLNASDYEPAVPNWATITNVNNQLKITRGSADTIYYGNKSIHGMTLQNGYNYYIATYIKTNTSANLRISLRQSNAGVQDSNPDVGLISNNYGIKSRIVTITNYLNARILQFQTTNSDVNIEIYHNSIKVIDLTSLGISSLTVAQMDYWFNVYQQYKDDNGLKSTVDSLNTLKEKDSEIEFKVTTIEEAYRKSQSGELTATKSGTDIISLGKDVAPAPLQVKVDGGLKPALENLVTNGDFSSGTTGWNIVGLTTDTTNGYLRATATTSYPRISQSFTPLQNDIIYLSFRYKNQEGGNLRITNTPGLGEQELAVLNQTNWTQYKNSVKITHANSSTISIRNFERDGMWFDIDKFMLFNLTASHGVTSTSGEEYDNAVADIEAMLALNGGYISTTPIHAVGMNKRVRAVGRNLFDGTYLEVVINPGGQTISNVSAKTTNYIPILPNQVYTISGTNLNRRRYNFYDENYNFISYHSAVEGTYTNFTLEVSPSNARYIQIYYSVGVENGLIQLELGSTATPYVPYTNTDLYLQANKVGYKLPNGVADTIEHRNGKYYFVKCVQEYTFTGNENWVLDNGASQVNTIVFKYLNTLIKNNTLGLIMSGFPAKPDDILYIQDSEAISFGTYMGRDFFAVKILRSRLTTEDINGFKSYLQTNPTTLYFELATPIETEILALGNAQGLSGGTVYIDDVMADSNLYTHRYDIENTAYPIKSLDRIVKINADGSQTELEVSSAIIAGDGLSFTHPSLVANDIVWVSYAYNVANLFKSNTFITYYDNPFIAVQPNGTPRRITFSVDDSGVVTVSSIAV